MGELPTGTVTFLFTDVEDSTGLVRDLRDAYPGVIADHRRLVRGAVEECGGYEIDSRGDEFFLVFARPADAVEAAIAIQHQHESHGWPGERPVRVRMGIHTGEPVVVENDLPPLRLASEAAADPQAEPVGGSPQKEARQHRVVLADDSVLLREGVALLLSDAGFEVVGQSGTADDLLLKVRSYSPDVAVVDIRMPPTQTDEGLRAAQEIRAKHPEVGVLVLSQHVEPAYAMELLAESAEGVGYLLKDRVADVDEFAAAVRRVAEGGSALDPTIVSQLLGRRRGDDPLAKLTPREREVLELMAEGRSNQGIAERLVITERAVQKHITSIFDKLGLSVSGDDHRRVLAVL